jgi:uncharacterized protein (TIGR00730 family)
MTVRRTAEVLTDDQRAQRNLRQILASSSYRLAERDIDLLAQPELRPVRMQLELLKPELAFIRQNILSTIVVFGSTQIVERQKAEELLAAAEKALAANPDDPLLKRAVARRRHGVAKSRYYDEARQFTRLVTSSAQAAAGSEFVVVTGGGPGIMEAANRGAFDVGGKSIGLNITLPAEQMPNPYITPDLCFQFHYFALRKLHFLLRAKALIVFPGGFGTLDELFDALTLRQTNRMQAIPIVMYGRDYWRQVVDFQFLADQGAIEDEHLKLIDYADTPQDAWNTILRFYQLCPQPQVPPRPSP